MVAAMKILQFLLALLAPLSFALALTPDEIEKRVALSAPAADERRLDEIGWAADIRTALKLAKEHARPVFLFTHDGRMAAGRC
jgi:hypothetical protein